MPDNVIHELQQPLTLINVSDVTEEEHEKVRNSGTTATSTSCRGWPLAQAMLSPRAGASTPHPAATMVGTGATGAGAVLPPVYPIWRSDGRMLTFVRHTLVPKWPPVAHVINSPQPTHRRMPFVTITPLRSVHSVNAHRQMSLQL